MTEPVLVFAGPTRIGLPAAVLAAAGAELVWRGPARAGDLDALGDAGPRPAGIAIVDGCLEADGALSVEEIGRALRRDSRIWGLASTGAVRARELSGQGMRGFGRVYGMLEARPDLGADEVALLHAPVPPYGPFSEPLVHLRAALADLGERGILNQRERRTALAMLAALPVGERTVGGLARILAGILRCPQCRIAAWVEPFDRYRVKQQDLRDFLAERPWRC